MILLWRELYLNAIPLFLQTVQLLNSINCGIKPSSVLILILLCIAKGKNEHRFLDKDIKNAIFSLIDELEEKGLALEVADAKFSRQGDAVLKILQELQKLAASQQNQQRARLFYKFVSGLRNLHNTTLGSLVPKMMETSRYVPTVHYINTTSINYIAK